MKRFISLLNIVLVLSLLMAGCTTPTPEMVEVEVTRVKEPPYTEAPEPTLTPAPPYTETPEPTLTPDPIDLLKGPLGIEAELKDEAHILTEDTLAELIDYDEGTLVFPASAKGAQEIKEGQVIVGGVTAQTPDGLLRKVTSVESVTDIEGRPGWASGGLLGKPVPANSGVWLVIRTMAAQFQDLFKNAEVYDDKVLGGGDIDQTETEMDGLDISGGKIYIEVNEEITDSESGAKATINGGVTVEPQFDFNIIILDGSLQWIRMSNRTILESHLEFAAGIEFKQGAQVLLKEIKFQRRTFLVAVPLLPVLVPVVYRPVLSIHIGADGKIASTMTLSAEHKVTYHRGLIYDGQNWNKFKYADTESWEFDPSISVRFDARAYFAPRLEIEFYGVLGPYVEASVYMRFELDPTADHWWKLAAGMEAAVGIEFEVLGDVLFGYEKEILTVPEWTIAQAESPPAPTSPDGSLPDLWQELLTLPAGSDIMNLKEALIQALRQAQNDESLDFSEALEAIQEVMELPYTIPEGGLREEQLPNLKKAVDKVKSMSLR